MVERERRQRVERVPGRVLRHGGIDVGGHEAEIRGHELPAQRVPVGLAPRLELLEVRDLAHVDLLREMAPDRLLERLVRRERAAGQRPRPRERIAGTLPQQRLQAAVAHLDDGAEHAVGHRFRSSGGRKPCRLCPKVIAFEEKTAHRTLLRPGRRRRRGRRPLRGALLRRARRGCCCWPRARCGRRTATRPRAASRPRSARTTTPPSTRPTRCTAGRGLCRPGAVRVLTEEAPARIADLVALGVEFDDGLGARGRPLAPPRRPRRRRRDGTADRGGARRAGAGASAHRRRRGRARARALAGGRTLRRRSSPSGGPSRRGRRCSPPAATRRSGSGRRIRPARSARG